MAQLVFVHGVSVRKNQEYEKGVQRRHEAFKETGFRGGPVEFHDPYWGEHGADPSTIKSLNLDGDIWLGLGAPEDYSGMDNPLLASDLIDTSLRDAADADFAATVNSLSIILADPNNPSGDHQLAVELADYLVTLDDAGLKKPEWMTSPKPVNDDEFVYLLEQAVHTSSDMQTLGLGEALKKAARWLVIGPLGGPLAQAVRNFTPALAVFLGDAFIYLKRGGIDDNRYDSIRTTIGTDLVKAAKNANAGGEKLIVVGHSMGANILYDMLIDKKFVKSLEDEIGGKLAIDLFLTVGTQVGLLQDLKLFENTEGLWPAPCRLWWHVYNKMDVLSFGASESFEGPIKQFSCNTHASILDAHNAYFSSLVFQKQLYNRMKSEGLVG